LKNYLQIKSNYLRFLLISSYTLFNVLAASAQNKTNTLSLTTTSIDFNLSTYAQLETEQSIANAFSLSVSSASNTYHLYARVSGVSTGNTIPVSKMAIQLVSSTVTANTIPVTGKISLSNTNQLLVSNSKKFGTVDNLNYKLFFGPLGYDYAPGTYTFTILFTMTQP
jgi:hypothetical protein